MDIYNFSRDFSQIYKGPGDAIQEDVSKESGTFPDCLPKEWKGGFPAKFKGCYAEKKCSCGEHTLFALRTPQEAWPENGLVRIKVIAQ